jgi:hypothetical protein
MYLFFAVTAKKLVLCQFNNIMHIGPYEDLASSDSEQVITEGSNSPPFYWHYLQNFGGIMEK